MDAFTNMEALQTPLFRILMTAPWHRCNRLISSLWWLTRSPALLPSPQAEGMGLKILTLYHGWFPWQLASILKLSRGFQPSVLSVTNSDVVERGLWWITKDAPLTLSGNYMGFRNSVPGSRDKDQIYIYCIAILQNHVVCYCLLSFFPPIFIKLISFIFSNLYAFYIFFLFFLFCMYNAGTTLDTISNSRHLWFAPDFKGNVFSISM